MSKTGIAILVALFALAGLVASLAPGTAQAAGDWYVNPGESIQSAIDAASAAGGGTVHVAAGTYYELIVLRNGVAVVGAGRDVTTINGDTDGNGTGNGTVVTATDVDSTARLDGFTVRNGTGTFYDGEIFGGGMFLMDSAVSIDNCIFCANSADEGGGIYNRTSTTTLTQCVIENNVATLGSGGGIYNVYGSTTVTDSVFRDNLAINGGGMYNYANISVTVIDSGFSGNSANYGGGLYNDRSMPLVVLNCVFNGNTATGLSPKGMGAAIYNIWCDPALVNCTLWGNVADGSAGGIFNNSSSPIVTNCILHSNAPDEIFDVGTSLSDVTYSDVQGGYPGTGNIDLDPKFYDPAHGDFRLTRFSPCVDTGTNTGAPPTDFEGEARPFDGDGDGNAITDMGADEWHTGAPTAPVPELPTILLTGMGLLALGSFLYFKGRKRVCMSIAP